MSEGKERVLITGGCGLIGGILRRSLGSGYDFSCLCQEGGGGCAVGDVTDLTGIEPYFEGRDAVVHLAADSRVEATWESVYSNNILGTYNVLEASRRQGVKRVIYASSNHVTGLYERDGPICSVVRGSKASVAGKLDHRSPPRPDSLYGVSKLFGEGLCQYFSAEYSLSMICLRIGTVLAGDDPRICEPRCLATWLSHRDLVQLVERSLGAEGVRFDIFYGVSNNRRRFWDISHAREVLGYVPLDDAETFATS